MNSINSVVYYRILLRTEQVKRYGNGIRLKKARKIKLKDKRTRYTGKGKKHPSKGITFILVAFSA